MRMYAGKTVYLMGGSSGIGLSAGCCLAGSGSHVFLFARSEARLKAALEKVEAQRVSPDQRFAFRSLDVADHAAVQAVTAEAVRSFGGPDILINSAGRAIPRRFEEIPYGQFDETMKINLYGVWNCIYALMPHMKAKGGIIVNVSSLVGFMGVFGYADYCASKFAIIGLSQVLRQELRPYGIRVCVLCPPDTDTPGFATENLTKPPETRAISSGARVMSSDDVAKALLRGMERRRFLIIPGAEGKMAYFVQRYAPFVLERIMQSAIRKVREGQA